MKSFFSQLTFLLFLLFSNLHFSKVFALQNEFNIGSNKRRTLVNSNKLKLRNHKHPYDFNKPQWILKFADHLADSGDFYRAITEYKRAKFLFPTFKKREWVDLQIGKLYYQGGRYAQAIEALTPMTVSVNSKIRSFSKNWLAQSYFEYEDYVNSFRLFGDLLGNTALKERSVDYYIYRGLAKAFMKEFDLAKSQLKLAQDFESSLGNRQKEYHMFLSSSQKLLEQAKENLESRKSPFLAAILGLFPGLGSIYLGKWDNALVAFLVVGSTSFLAYKGFVDDNDVQLGVFAGLASGFYAGSIYSGYRTAIKHNLLLGQNEIKTLKSNFKDFQVKLRYNHPTSY